MQSIRTRTNDPWPGLDTLPLHLTPELNLPPEQLKARLAGLIRAAVNQGAAAVADAVVRHFLALSLHPQLVASLDERAAYCHGACHWRRLAAISDRAHNQGVPRGTPRGTQRLSTISQQPRRLAAGVA